MKRLGRNQLRWKRRRGQSLVLMFFVFVALIGVMALTSVSYTHLTLPTNREV